MTKADERALPQRVDDLERGFALLGRIVEEIALAAGAAAEQAAQVLAQIAAEQVRLASALQTTESGAGRALH